MPTLLEPKQIEIGGKRYYQVTHEDGTKQNLRSVTTVEKSVRLASFLDQWEDSMIEQLGVEGFKKHMDILARRGTLVHSLIERKTLGQEIVKTFDIADEDWAKYEAFLRWQEKHKPEYIWRERVLYSLMFGYAGRSDAKVRINGKTYILDYKTSKKVQDSHRCQGSAYFNAELEMGEKSDGIIILALGADTKQGYSETWIEKPEDINHYMRGFYLKNELLNWSSPIPNA